MRDFRDFAQIGNDHYRIRRRLNENHLGVWLDCRFNVERV